MTSFAPRFRRCAPRGLTLVELLVVIAIIGVLVALLLPAVQSARESSRMASCRNNVRQFALALLQHAGTKKQFPKGLVCTTGTCDLSGTWLGSLSARSTDWGESFTIRVLPYMEFQAIHDAYDFKQPNSVAVNNQAVIPWLPPLLCPSRDRGVLFMKDSGANRRYVSRIHYGGNFGAGWAISQQFSWQPGLRGVFDGGKQWGASPKDLTDGMSKTLLLGEITIDPTSASDSRGVWNLQGSTAFSGGINVAAPTTADIIAKMRPPNGRTLPVGATSNDMHVSSDNAIYCPNTRPLPDQPYGYFCTDGSTGVNVRSSHMGGAHVALADGSVRFITDTIDLITWYRLHTIQGGETVGEY